jgi:hypothetical protein
MPLFSLLPKHSNKRKHTMKTTHESTCRTQTTHPPASRATTAHQQRTNHPCTGGTGWLRATLVLCTLLGSLLTASAGALLTQYFPMNHGDTRLYAASFSSLQVTETFMRGTYAGMNVVIFSDTETQANRYYANAGNTVVCHGLQFQGETLRFNPALVILDESSLASGGSRSSSCTVQYGGYTITVLMTSTVSLAGTVTVPAGVFNNCRRLTVDLTLSAPGEDPEEIELDVMYLAPNAGIIRHRVVDQFLDPLGWLELVSGTVGGQPITSDCSYTLNATGTNRAWTAGSGSFGITSLSACNWNATSTASWLRSSSSGSGSGTISYSLDANPTADFRTGAILVDGKAFTVTQGPKGYAWRVQFGWIYDAGDSWYHSDCLGWLWFAPGNVWVYSSNLSGWLAITDPNSPTVWSTQFRWFKAPHNPPCLADTTCLGQVHVGTYNGTAIPDGWVVSERFGFVWAVGDGVWYSTEHHGWVGAMPDCGLWCVTCGRFL